MNFENSINSVKVIQDSSNSSGNRMTTFEIETYRYIWAEILTHKMLNKNAQSSRAVPTKNVLGANELDPVTPIIWGKNKAGMSATEGLTGEELQQAKDVWNSIAQNAFESSKVLSNIGLHKMWANRITEPFSRIKVVVSGTEWDNFFWLRDDIDAAQPEIVDLARKAKEAMNQSNPIHLNAGELHVPYVRREVTKPYSDFTYFSENGLILTKKEAAIVSASCIAQVSYRKLDDSFDKALEVYKKLFSGPKPHMSPTEHIAVALSLNKSSILQRIFPSRLPVGVSHVDRNGKLWSANLQGFIQYRKLLEIGVDLDDGYQF